jgi:hypothetical protein
VSCQETHCEHRREHVAPKLQNPVASRIIMWSRCFCVCLELSLQRAARGAWHVLKFGVVVAELSAGRPWYGTCT